MVNSPYAPEAIAAWRQAGAPRVEIGWHPCLTQDPPVAGAERRAQLVDLDGSVAVGGDSSKPVTVGRIRVATWRRELAAQYDRFVEWVGGRRRWSTPTNTPPCSHRASTCSAC